MFYWENENSLINKTLKSLEKSHWEMQEEQHKRQSHSSFPLKDLFSKQMSNATGQSEEQIKSIIDESQQMLKVAAQRMRAEIKKDPWIFLGKVAIGTFGLGIVLGHHSPFGKRRQK